MAYYATHMHRVLTGRAGDWLARNGWPPTADEQGEATLTRARLRANFL